ncbi:unnamed protein product, partial [Polarella glacialis]
VIVWGHSLGAGIALGVVQALLQGEQELPLGLVLESPFLSFADAAADLVASWLPERLRRATRNLIFDRFREQRFNSAERIRTVAEQMPILVLHG